MPTVSKPNGDFTNNVDVADATKVNAQMNTLYNAVNGGLDNANVPTLGDMTTLTTTAKNTAVAAINEINANYPIQFLSRQALINGNFDVWQRGTSFSVGAGSPYTADRWQAYRASFVSGMTVSRQDGSGVRGSTYCLRAQRDSANTATNNLQLSQSLESFDSQKFRGKKVTLSFYARSGSNFSSTSSQILVYLGSGTGTDNSALSITGYATPINAIATISTSWQKFSFTTPVVLADTVNQLFAQFTTSTLSGTAGANDYFEITQVQLNAGDQALPFQPKSFADELALCQRYYEKSYAYGSFAGSTDSGNEEIYKPYSASGNGFSAGTFKVAKRIAPTVQVYASRTGTLGKVRDVDGSVELTATLFGNGDKKVGWIDAGVVTSGNRLIWHWTADSEI